MHKNMGVGFKKVLSRYTEDGEGQSDNDSDRDSNNGDQEELGDCKSKKQKSN